MRQNDLLNPTQVTICGSCSTATSNPTSSTVNAAKCLFQSQRRAFYRWKKLPQDMYRLLALDEDISDRQRQQRDRRAELIAPLLAEECICDKSYRNRVLREIVSVNSVSRKTVLQYLWLYWVYQSKMRYCPPKIQRRETSFINRRKAIRWALNKFYYTPQKQSLQTSYKMMLRSNIVMPKAN